jgi:outer membrane protein TolC
MTRITLLMGIISLLFCTGCFRRPHSVYVERQKNLVIDKPCIYPSCSYDLECLSLEEAVNIGLCVNWKVRFQQTMERVQREIATAETLKMLPTLSVDGEVSKRSNLFLVRETAPSSELTTRRVGVGGLWNLIEFGITYFKSKQERLRVKVVEQQKIRSRHQLILEITASYWKCVAYYNLIKDQEKAIQLLKERIAVLNEEIEQDLITKAEGLAITSELYKKITELTLLERQYDTFRLELLNNMGLPASTEVSFPVVTLEDLFIPEVDMGYLEELALSYRPELVVDDMQEKISVEEAKLNIIKALPGFNLFLDHDWDKNIFLIHKHWSNIGFRALWDFFSIPSQLSLKKAACNQALYYREERLSISAGILSQVNLSYQELQNILKEYVVLQERYRNRGRYIESLTSRIDCGMTKGGDFVLPYSEYIIDKSLAFISFANFKTELERLAISVGFPMMFYKEMSSDVITITDVETFLIEELDSLGDDD